MRYLCVCLAVTLGSAISLVSSQAAPNATPDPAMVRLRAALTPEYPTWSLSHTLSLCAEFLSTVNEPDRCYIRFFDFSDVPRDELPAQVAALFYDTNAASRAPIVYVPRPVPNADRRIFWIDTRWYFWTAEVWENISLEDPYFREPIIDSHDPGLLFLKQQTKANPIIRGDWFTHYVLDNSEFLAAGKDFNQNAFYYQLLYASVGFEREVEETTTEEVEETVNEEREVTTRDEYDRPVKTKKTVPVKKKVQKKTTKKVTKKVFGVGPATVAEFEQAWQVDTKGLKELPVDLGFFVDEGDSGVSFQNRLGWFVPGRNNYYRTFDVFRTAFAQDFLENPFPTKFDAGEHIVVDAKGAQFFLLSNGKGETLDYGDPRVVRDDRSGSRVLVTPMSCMACHQAGIIPWKSGHRRLQEIGARLQAETPEKAERFRQFFLQDRVFQQKAEQDSKRYVEFVKDCNGLSPAENWAQLSRARVWYRKPVTLEQAARDLGAPTEELRNALGFQATKGRLRRLVLDGGPIPRLTWERGGYQEAGLLLREWRKKMTMNVAPLNAQVTLGKDSDHVPTSPLRAPRLLGPVDGPTER